MANKEDIVVNLATVKVLQEEAGYMDGLKRQYYLQVDGNPVGAQDTVNEIIKESERLDDTKHQADEEEGIIYNLERKRK